MLYADDVVILAETFEELVAKMGVKGIEAEHGENQSIDLR